MLHVTAAIVGEGLCDWLRSSPTAASPARRTASWSATSRPKPCTAGRSRRSRTATRVIDVAARELRVELSDDELAARLDAWCRRRRATRPACSRSTRASSPPPPRAPSPARRPLQPSRVSGRDRAGHGRRHSGRAILEHDLHSQAAERERPRRRPKPAGGRTQGRRAPTSADSHAHAARAGAETAGRTHVRGHTPAAARPRPTRTSAPCSRRRRGPRRGGARGRAARRTTRPYARRPCTTRALSPPRATRRSGGRRPSRFRRGRTSFRPAVRGPARGCSERTRSCTTRPSAPSAGQPRGRRVAREHLDRGALNVGMAAEVRAHQLAVPRPVVLRVGGRVDARIPAAAAHVALECALLNVVEHVAGRARKITAS